MLSSPSGAACEINWYISPLIAAAQNSWQHFFFEFHVSRECDCASALGSLLKIVPFFIRDGKPYGKTSFIYTPVESELKTFERGVKCVAKCVLSDARKCFCRLYIMPHFYFW